MCIHQLDKLHRLANGMTAHITADCCRPELRASCVPDFSQTQTRTLPLALNLTLIFISTLTRAKPGRRRPGLRADARLPRLLCHQGGRAVIHAVDAVPAAGDERQSHRHDPAGCADRSA